LQGNLDYYFWLLAGIQVANILAFTWIARQWYKSRPQGGDLEKHGPGAGTTAIEAIDEEQELQGSATSQHGQHSFAVLPSVLFSMRMGFPAGLSQSSLPSHSFLRPPASKAVGSSAAFSYTSSKPSMLKAAAAGPSQVTAPSFQQVSSNDPTLGAAETQSYQVHKSLTAEEAASPKAKVA